MPTAYSRRVSRFCATISIVWVTAATAWANNDEDPFAPETESARDASTSGPELGLRLGLTSGIGDFEAGRSIADSVGGMLPLWVDAGYRLFDRWFIGVYWQYGLGLPSSTSTTECRSCVHSAIKYGLQVNYTFFAEDQVRTWAGLGFGHQSFESVNEDTKRGVAYSGWEPLSVHFGSSWQPTPGVEIGPFFTFAYGAIGSKKDVCYEPNRDRCPPEDEQDVSGGGPVVWSTFGIRAVFLP